MPNQIKSLIVLFSYYLVDHNTTEKIANVFARVLDVKIRTPQQFNPDDLQDYNLIGFGSGIYNAKHHKVLLDLADKLPKVNNKKAFIFSTCGFPENLQEEGEFRRSVHENHSFLRERLQSKGYTIVDEFSCPGYNTNSFLKRIGGINKGRPNAEDLKHAEEFAQNLKQNLQK